MGHGSNIRRPGGWQEIAGYPVAIGFRAGARSGPTPGPDSVGNGGKAALDKRVAFGRAQRLRHFALQGNGVAVLKYGSARVRKPLLVGLIPYAQVKHAIAILLAVGHCLVQQHFQRRIIQVFDIHYWRVPDHSVTKHHAVVESECIVVDADPGQHPLRRRGQVSIAGTLLLEGAGITVKAPGLDMQFTHFRDQRRLDTGAGKMLDPVLESPLALVDVALDALLAQ